MGIPAYDEFMLPLLQILGDRKEHSVQEVRESLAEHFHLTEEDLKVKLPSGKQSLFANRVGWAKTYLGKAGLVESKKRGLYEITPSGLEVLAEGPDKIDKDFLNRFDEFREFLNYRKQGTAGEAVTTMQDAGVSLTPKEVLENAYEELQRTLTGEIREKLYECSPALFEKMVVDILLGMGYGGSRKDAGHSIGGSGDEGIDGIIKEDKLGLDVIYIQAKRWKNPVGRPEIQSFVGALVGQKARKGVFITTATFTGGARKYVDSIENSVVLVDGEELAQLMIQHGLGVSTEDSFEIKRIDNDYFEE